MLTNLAQIYRTELLAVTSMSELGKRLPRETSEILERATDLHQENVSGLSAIFEQINYSPSNDVMLPARVEKLLEKKNFPDRLLFHWLSEFEGQLRTLYSDASQLDPSSVPSNVWKNLDLMRERQEALSIDISAVTFETTEILDPAAWD